ncbi:hypothetical protein BCR41DRAFT_348115 [Lobosporangium transversale]|uniref:Uncharacterized protein n=1 Tax=Lobosporangium transversale TaxID=64571 RepID=A0A1Y2GZT5_9FUNG|nr:hypothetical protein BCR41DRAFT_348110 [Lobosporangium transversale]XP_021884087.1 hypothetical protein BCR41DRAFT_348115 [Lobosporangium transversale]ORZ26319.1 hypothetical protein BCR41DRAFT_348110 [Lobosporangium transversale]ORZ26322.1 hypothetical protein BCR41DRAFT_348115 [Lobosporangium transversale]|eukprot:XP_021884084.1 hypothetical protein BCR41DRAFT_348110 [Lobosporangium transversale]
MTTFGFKSYSSSTVENEYFILLRSAVSHIGKYKCHGLLSGEMQQECHTHSSYFQGKVHGLIWWLSDEMNAVMVNETQECHQCYP